MEHIRSFLSEEEGVGVVEIILILVERFTIQIRIWILSMIIFMEKYIPIVTCNLILGIDEYLTGEDKGRANEYIQFKKFFQRIY